MEYLLETAIELAKHHYLWLIMVVGGLAIVLATRGYRTKCCANLKDKDAELDELFTEHGIELAIVMLPFITLFLLAVFAGRPQHIVEGNELSLAAAVLWCQLILRLNGATSHMVGDEWRMARSQTRQRILFSLLFLIVTLIPAAATELGGSGVNDALVHLVRVCAFLLAAFYFLRWGIGSSLPRVTRT